MLRCPVLYFYRYPVLQSDTDVDQCIFNVGKRVETAIVSHKATKAEWDLN